MASSNCASATFAAAADFSKAIPFAYQLLCEVHARRDRALKARNALPPHQAQTAEHPHLDPMPKLRMIQHREIVHCSGEIVADARLL